MNPLTPDYSDEPASTRLVCERWRDWLRIALPQRGFKAFFSENLRRALMQILVWSALVMLLAWHGWHNVRLTLVGGAVVGLALPFLAFLEHARRGGKRSVSLSVSPDALTVDLKDPLSSDRQSYLRRIDRERIRSVKAGWYGLTLRLANPRRSLHIDVFTHREAKWIAMTIRREMCLYPDEAGEAQSADVAQRPES